MAKTRTRPGLPNEYAKIDLGLREQCGEKLDKNPKMPTFPPAPAATAQKLREIIDAGGPQAPLAYSALSRLCVLWTPGAVAAGALGGGQMGIIVNDLVRIFLELFPGGEGLPEEAKTKVSL